MKLVIAVLFIGQVALTYCGSDSYNAVEKDYNYDNDCSFLWMMMHSGVQGMGLSPETIVFLTVIATISSILDNEIKNWIA